VGAQASESEQQEKVNIFFISMKYKLFIVSMFVCNNFYDDDDDVREQ
jgi:hypothetical protein